jgi:DNA polymerase-3 subunit alpha
LNITSIDPLKYGLIWERFLNVGRKGLPDIDSDVPRSKRGLVLDYIKLRFGENNVAQLITFNKLAARAVLKDVFKVFGMEFTEANAITKLLPMFDEDHVSITLDKAIDMVPDLQKYEEQYKPWFSIARTIEGCYKSLGTHAAAVVISDKPFSEGHYPLCKSADTKSLIFSWNMDVVDKLHLLKLDILGLSTLDVIQNTFDLIGGSISLESIPLDDSKTFELLAEGKTVGVFQLEKQLGKTWCKLLKPNSIEEIAAVISAIRPGALESLQTQTYFEVKTGEREPDYLDQRLIPILDKTYSAMLYQEQTIEICKQLAGMSLVEADSVRKCIGKKDPEELKKWKDRFISGCNNNLSVEQSEEIWGWVERTAGYSFCRAHGVGYGLLSYYTAYLKANYPTQFLCAALKSAKYAQDQMSEIKKFVHDAKLFNIDVIPPKASKGNIDFDIMDDGRIAFGLSSLKGVGEKSIPNLQKAASLSDSFDSFLFNAKINRRVMEAMILGGALDEFDMSRSQMLARYELFDALTDNEIKLAKGPKWLNIVRDLADESLFESYKGGEIRVPNSRRRGVLRELLKGFDAVEMFDREIDRINWERNYLGISLTGSLTSLFKTKNKCSDIITFDKNSNESIELAVIVSGVKEFRTKTGNMMGFMTAGDETYELDNFVIFPKPYERFKAILEMGNILKVRGKMSDRGSIVVSHLERFR